MQAQDIIDAVRAQVEACQARGHLPLSVGLGDREYEVMEENPTGVMHGSLHGALQATNAFPQSGILGLPVHRTGAPSEVSVDSQAPPG